MTQPASEVASQGAELFVLTEVYVAIVPVAIGQTSFIGPASNGTVALGHGAERRAGAGPPGPVREGEYDLFVQGRFRHGSKFLAGARTRRRASARWTR